jgi:hypothetical protein
VRMKQLVLITVGVLVAAAIIGGALVMRSSHGARHTTAPVAVARTGTIQGTLLAVGGPVGGPRPWQDQVFRLLDRSGAVAYTGRTDKHGRFLIHAKPGAYTLFMPGMMLVTRSSDVALSRRVLLVVAGHTIRPNIILTNPLWA